ncbi:hypothetical protein [Actinomadura sp. RB99]|uniref:hypothetical protein n=1 Tax=Actinomadura sp. RB99 TaxID=2691577 RepID=UPI0016825579|nr:hypothetical protein [Actinomadura sp. RB99]
MAGAEVEPFAAWQKPFYLHWICPTGHLCLPALAPQGGGELEPGRLVLLVPPPSSFIHEVMVLDPQVR